MTLRARLLLGTLVALAFATVAPNALAAAKVRILHGAPDVPAVTVYVNGQAAVASLGTLEATGYLDLPAGSYDVAVALAGQPVSAAVLQTRLTLEDGKRYTGFATGLLARGTLKLGAKEDVARAPFTRSSLRVWHNSPDAPNVDVLVNGNRVLANVPYETSSAYLPLAPGTYAVQINVAGTATSVFRGDVTLAAGESYTAVALGSVTGTGAPFTVEVLRDATAGALVRVLHAAPDVPAVTVYVNGERVLARLRPITGSRYLALDPGTYDVAVSLAGRPASAAVLTAKVTVQDKSRYTAVARGLLAKETVELAVQRDLAIPPAEQASVRVWHLSPDAPRVDVFVNGTKTLARVPNKTASAYLELDAGSYRIRVAVAGTSTTVWAGSIAVKAGRAYSATALGSVGGTGKRFRVALLHG